MRAKRERWEKRFETRAAPSEGLNGAALFASRCAACHGTQGQACRARFQRWQATSVNGPAGGVIR